jgi:hypothetical protein
VLLLAAGCSRSDIVPVSGRVTLDGKPLAGAVITFQPISDPNSDVRPASGSVGRTDAEGRYSLRLIEPECEGALAGPHIVTITTATARPGDDASRPQGEQAPKAWRDGSERFEVPAGGTTSADFDLQSSPT